MKRLNFLIFTLLSLLLFSCLVNSSEDSFDSDDVLENEQKDQNNVIEKDDELFVLDNSKYVFETNSSRFISKKGYTVWTKSKINNSKIFEQINTVVAKESGNKDAGFGIVFCEKEDENGFFLLAVLINVKGMYTVGKYESGEFTSIVSWRSSGRLRTGYGVNNQISVSYIKETKEFSLSFNGQEVKRFSTGIDMDFLGTGCGYVTVISDSEKFPEVPVKVVFENK